MHNIFLPQLEFDNKPNEAGQEYFDNEILPALKQNGRWYGTVDKDLYHKMPGISSSKLKAFVDDKFKVKFLKDYPELREDEKKCFELGRLFHEVLLEDKKLCSDFTTIESIMLADPDSKNPRNKGDYKAAKQMAEDRGETMVPHVEYTMFQCWRETVESHPELKALMTASEGYREKSFFVIEPQTNLILKGSFDIHVPNKNMIADVKFMAGRKNWDDEIAEYRFDIQEVFYKEVLSLYSGKPCFKAFPFLRFIKKIPFRVYTNAISDAFIDIAQEDCLQGLKDIKEAYQTGDWGSAYDGKVHIGHPPDWFLNKREGEI